MLVFILLIPKDREKKAKLLGETKATHYLEIVEMLLLSLFHDLYEAKDIICLAGRLCFVIVVLSCIILRLINS